MKSDVLFNNDAHLQLKEAVDLICNAVKVTLGPRGKNVLTINSCGDAHLTKDGITVAKNVTSSDPIINGVLNVVREASANTAKQAGDGTTSTLVLTQAIFNGGLELIKEGCNPTLLKQGMQEALDVVLDYIEAHSEKITLDDEKLRQVAYISANNDDSVGMVALEAVRKAKGTGICRIEDSKNTDTTIKCTNGLTFDKGYISPHFLTGDKTTIEYDNPLVFISSIELSNKTIIDLMKHAKDNGRPLVVIAPEFNENIFMSMFKNYKAGAVDICPVKLPGFAGNRSNWIDDISAYVDGECFTSNNVNPIKFLGESERIIISATETTIINNTPTLRCNSHIKTLQSLAIDADAIELEILNKRIATLQGRVVTIFVGATTELELKEKKDRIEDAVCALQTALQGGISEGGGMTFFRAAADLYNSSPEDSDVISGYNLIIDSLLQPFEQLCINSDKDYAVLCDDWREDETLGYNFKTLQWENLKESGVIDPTLVLKQSITNAVGIASNLLTTECITYYE